MLLSFIPTCDAHGFGERYDLPVPMSWVIIAACCVVALSFCLTPFLDSNTHPDHDTFLDLGNFNLTPQAFKTTSPGGYIFMGLSSVLLVFVWSCASLGIQDPMMNFAPTFIWIIWWLGTSFACLILGNIWRHMDPWMGLFLALRSFKNRFIGRVNFRLDDRNPNSTTKDPLQWPEPLGRWPACLTLLMWCGLEIIYPIASMPERLGAFILIYSLYTWLGMLTFGVHQWRMKGDGFTLYFELIALLRAQIITLLKINRSRGQRAFSNTDVSTNTSASESTYQSMGMGMGMGMGMSMRLSTIGLVMAMFSSVLFDGLHASQGWLVFEGWLGHLPFLKHDVNGYYKGALGLLLLWMSLTSTYMFTCFLTQRMIKVLPHLQHFESPLEMNTTTLACSFLSSLLPIAMAYLIAHNFSSFFIQGQNIIALASDPYGLGWDLWGTSHFYPDITLIDAKFTWYVASISIVVGHVISIFMAHHTACALSAHVRQLSHLIMLKNGAREVEYATIKPWILNLPMTLVMIAFTALSLSIIAEPLTTGGGL